jgi:hypothetical protein
VDTLRQPTTNPDQRYSVRRVAGRRYLFHLTATPAARDRAACILAPGTQFSVSRFWASATFTTNQHTDVAV